jgi:carboxylate-amine ligase
VVGGGTHPFQQWHERRIYDKPRFRELSELYGYLSKQFTIFGQHVHIGCPDADAALLMLHRMSRYIPHFIALSASSPYVQGQDTAFDSARLNSVFAFPLSGRAPFVLTWDEFHRLLRQDDPHRRGQEHEGLLLGHPPQARVRHHRNPRVRHPADHRARRRPGRLRAVAGRLVPGRRSPSCRRRTTTSSTPTTASRPAASAWRRCTWTPPRGDHMPLREHILMTMDKIAGHARRMAPRTPCTCCAPTPEAGQNDARWLRERQREEQLLAEVSRQAAQRFRGAPV